MRCRTAALGGHVMACPATWGRTLTLHPPRPLPGERQRTGHSDDAERPGAQGRSCPICDEPLAPIAHVPPECPYSHRILLPQHLKSP
jgi:hypothetical protein